MSKMHETSRRRKMKLGRNVASILPSTVRLACGHEVTDHPVVIYPDRRRLFQCPEGCGLQKVK